MNPALPIKFEQLAARVRERLEKRLSAGWHMMENGASKMRNHESELKELGSTWWLTDDAYNVVGFLTFDAPHLQCANRDELVVVRAHMFVEAGFFSTYPSADFFLRRNEAAITRNFLSSDLDSVARFVNDHAALFGPRVHPFAHDTEGCEATWIPPQGPPLPTPDSRWQGFSANSPPLLSDDELDALMSVQPLVGELKALLLPGLVLIQMQTGGGWRVESHDRQAAFMALIPLWNETRRSFVLCVFNPFRPLHAHDHPWFGRDTFQTFWNADDTPSAVAVAIDQQRQTLGLTRVFNPFAFSRRSRALQHTEADGRPTPDVQSPAERQTDSPE